MGTIILMPIILMGAYHCSARAQASTKDKGKQVARQAKGKLKRKNRYVIKVMKINREGDGFPPSLIRENQRIYQAF